MLLKTKQQIVLIGLLIVGFLVFISFFNPSQNSIFLSVVFLFLLFIIFFLSVNVFLGFLQPNSVNRNSLLSAVIAMAPVYLLALSSLNSVSVIDLIFLIVIEIILVWYIRRQVK
jgi:hypothetical protein